MTIQPASLPLPIIAVHRLLVPVSIEAAILVTKQGGEVIGEKSWSALYVFGVRLIVWRRE